MATNVELVQFESELHQSGGRQYKIDTGDKKSLLGQGGFGVVVKAYCTVTHKFVAVKKVLPAILAEPNLALKTLREVQALLHFGYSDNIIKLIDMYNGPTTTFSGDDFEYMFIITEIWDFDLSKIISPRNFSSGFKLTHHHFKYFLNQLCIALTAMHQANTVHRDLKPSNILINKDCTLALCDLGLARSLDGGVHGHLTDYVVTRWYRSPEVTMGLDYTQACDMWSLGCILYEIMMNRPLLPVEARKTIGARGQLLCLLERLGVPPVEDIHKINNEKAREFILEVYPKCAKFPNPELIKELADKVDDDSKALDFMLKCLEFNPAKRMTAIQALRHPYLTQFYDVNKIHNALQTSKFQPDPIQVNNNNSTQGNLRIIKKNIRDVVFSFHNDDCSYSSFNVDEEDERDDCFSDAM